MYPSLCYFPEKEENVHPRVTVLTLDPTPVYFWRVKDMEIYASGLFPNLLIEYRGSSSNVVVISSKKLLSEKQKIRALGSECALVTCSHPPLAPRDSG